MTAQAAAALDVISSESQHKRVQQQVGHRQPSSGSDSSDQEDLITYGLDRRTTPAEARRTTMQKVDRRPPSTFHLKPRSQMNLAERICLIALAPDESHYLVDATVDRGPVPRHPLWKQHWFIWPRAMAPLIIHHLSYRLLPDKRWPIHVAYPFYLLCYILFAASCLHHLNHYSRVHGTLAEKNIGRDRVPDRSVRQIAIGISSYMVIRTGMNFYLGYNENMVPLTDISWTFPARLLMWQIVLDYLFYCYHRSSHEIDALWSIHQKHHTTKHPTAVLAILADEPQELLEIFILPFLTSLLVPMSFSEMWLTMEVTIYVEMMGHSGIRAYWPHPTLNHVFTWFDAEGIIEDHDLHHRFGKSGKNYGKQSRIFDRLFGTTTERIECYGMNGHSPGQA
ncbi:hypothetical protein OIO90_005515 [Microbotryomycetes sp. JL221]|nr:hypothetical protein OIO90_005515 [Microbotryomycetes sp. JL221]